MCSYAGRLVQGILLCVWNSKRKFVQMEELTNKSTETNWRKYLNLEHAVNGKKYKKQLEEMRNEMIAI